MTGNSKDVPMLAIWGLHFEGVLQTARTGDEASRAFRMDCPEGRDFVCVNPDPNACPFLSGFRRNKKDKKYWVLCDSTRRKGKTSP